MYRLMFRAGVIGTVVFVLLLGGCTERRGSPVGIDLIDEDQIGEGPIVVRSLERAFSKEDDQWVRFEIARSLYAIDPVRGKKVLEILQVDEEIPEFLKYQISEILDSGH